MTQRKQAKAPVVGNILLLHYSCGFSFVIGMKHKEGGKKKKVEWQGETQRDFLKCYLDWIPYISEVGADNSNTK